MDLMGQESLGVYDLPPQHIHFLDSIAKQSNLNVAIDKYFSGAMQGKRVQDMDQSDDDLKAAEFAAEVARRTADQDDARYQQTLDMLGQEMKSAPTIPNMTATRPNVLGSLGAAIGMAFAPGAGGSIMEGYNQGVNRNQQQELQGKQARYEAETDAYNKRLGIAKFRAERAGLTADKSQGQYASANEKLGSLKATAAQKKADREARAQQDAMRNQMRSVLKNVDDWRKIVSDLEDESLKPEGNQLLALYEQSNGALDPASAARLNQILSSRTLTNAGKIGKNEGQNLKNEHQRVINNWDDKVAEADYKNKVAMLGLRGLDAQLKKKALLYYDDNQKFKRLMIELAVNRENRAIQNDQLNNYLRTQDQNFDQKAKAVDGFDKQIEAKEKAIEDAFKGDMLPTDAYKFVTQTRAEIEALKKQRDAVMSTVPDFAPPQSNSYAPMNPFSGQIGNTGTGTRPLAVAPRSVAPTSGTKPASGTPRIPTEKNDVKRAKSRFGQTGK